MTTEIEKAAIGVTATALVTLSGGWVVKFFLKRQLKATETKFAHNIELMNVSYQKLVFNERLPSGWTRESYIEFPQMLDDKDFILRYRFCRWYWGRLNRLALDATEKYLNKVNELRGKIEDSSNDNQRRLLYQELMRFWVYCYAQMNNIGGIGSAESTLSTKDFIPAQIVKYRLEIDPDKAFQNYCSRKGIKINEGETALKLALEVAKPKEM